MLPLVTDGSEDPELEEEEEEEVIDHLRQHGVVNPEEEASLLAQGNSIAKLISEYWIQSCISFTEKIVLAKVMQFIYY